MKYALSVVCSDSDGKPGFERISKFFALGAYFANAVAAFAKPIAARDCSSRFNEYQNRSRFRASFPRALAQRWLRFRLVLRARFGPVVGMTGNLRPHMGIAVPMDFVPSPFGILIRFGGGRELRFSELRCKPVREPTGRQFQFISSESVERNDTFADFGGKDKAPVLLVLGTIRSTFDKIERLGTSLKPLMRHVLCCRTGFRAWKAAEQRRSD